MPPIEFPHRDYDDVRRIASDFLARHFPSLSIPIPIEIIAERELGIDIVPCPGLQDLRGIDAFMTRDGTEIRIDAQVYLGGHHRHRFSIAEELGHLLMHFEQVPEFESFEDWLRFRESLTLQAVNRVECQAKDFAGLVLVPPGQLKAHTLVSYRQLADQWGAEFTARVATSEEFWNAVMYEVCEPFEVSPKTAQIRLSKDGLWCSQL